MCHAQCTTEEEEEAAIYLMSANHRQSWMEFAADAISPNHNLRAAVATTIAPLITARTPRQYENTA